MAILCNMTIEMPQPNVVLLLRVTKLPGMEYQPSGSRGAKGGPQSTFSLWKIERFRHLGIQGSSYCARACYPQSGSGGVGQVPSMRTRLYDMKCLAGG